MMAEKENILELKNVVYSFHTYGGEVKAVRDVSFWVLWENPAAEKV